MKNLSSILFLILFVVSSTFAGGPWPQKKGQGYYKLSEWWLTYDQNYTDKSTISETVPTGIFITSIYAEYGITDRLTGILYAPIFVRHSFADVFLRDNTGTSVKVLEGQAVNSVGDFDLALKYGITSPGAKIPISVTLTFGLPSGKTRAEAFGSTVQTGDGEFNQMLQLDTGAGFQAGNTSLYTSAYVGFNNRTGGFSDELRFGLEFGAGFINQKLWLITRIGNVESFDNGDLLREVAPNIFAQNTEYTSFGIEAAYYITKKVGASVSFTSAFRGRNIAAAPSFSVGVFYDMSK